MYDLNPDQISQMSQAEAQQYLHQARDATGTARLSDEEYGRVRARVYEVHPELRPDVNHLGTWTQRGTGDGQWGHGDLSATDEYLQYYYREFEAQPLIDPDNMSLDHIISINHGWNPNRTTLDQAAHDAHHDWYHNAAYGTVGAPAQSVGPNTLAGSNFYDDD